MKLSGNKTKGGERHVTVRGGGLDPLPTSMKYGEPGKRIPAIPKESSYIVHRPGYGGIDLGCRKKQVSPASRSRIRGEAEDGNRTPQKEKFQPHERKTDKCPFM